MTEPVHTRSIRVSATRVGQHELEVTGHLVDERPEAAGRWFGIVHGRTIHDMTLTLRVRHPDLVVTHVEARMATHPYTVCPDALPPLQQLVGLSVTRGFTRAVNARFGRQKGCSHLTALLHAIAPVVRQGSGAAFRDEQAPPSAERDLWFIDTCQAWRGDGPLAGHLRAGDVSGVRAMSAYQRPGA